MDDLKRVLLDIVANDYEDFRTIVNEVVHELHRHGFDTEEVTGKALQELVLDGAIACYRYREDLKGFDRSEFSRDAMYEYSFYITALGRTLLQEARKD